MLDDYFTKNIVMQPKKDIGDYVESQGIPVPRRFANLSEARASGKDILVRSEHPQDYSGVSGLFESVGLRCFDDPCWIGYNPVGNDDDCLREQLADSWRAKFLCRLCGFNEEKFKGDFSVSYWEYLDGFNHKILADSSVKGRYHITTRNTEEDASGMYTIWDNDSQQSLHYRPGGIPIIIKENMEDLIDFYEKIRNLDRFDPNHCPLVEAQSVIKDGRVNHYFLQYHKTRDFNPVDFDAREISEADMISFSVVRGATEERIETHKMTVAIPGLVAGSPYEDIYSLPIGDFSYLDLREDTGAEVGFVFLERMIRDTQIVFSVFERGESLNELGYRLAVCGHSRSSRHFKPRVSAWMDKKTLNYLITDKEIVEMKQKAAKTGKVQTIDIDIVSDGRKAFARRALSN